MRHRAIGPISDTLAARNATFVDFPGYTPGSQVPWMTTRTGNPVRRHEVMDDMESPPPPCGFKPMSHDKIDVTWLVKDHIRKYYAYVDSQYPHRLHQMLYPDSYVVGGTYASPWPVEAWPSHEFDSPLEFSAEDYRRLTRCWDKITPKIEPKLDLLVFLAELKDITDLARHLGSIIDGLKNGVAGALQLIRDFKRYNGLLFIKQKRKASKTGEGIVRLIMNDATDSIANEWLMYNFALKPTVMDLIGILEGLLRFKSKLRALRVRSDIVWKTYAGYTEDTAYPLPVDYVSTCNLQANCVRDGQTCNYSGPNVDNAYATCRGTRLRKQFVGGYEEKFGITVLYSYSMPDELFKLENEIGAFMASIGIVPSLNTVWELIPFSFVVDWFIPIGKFLSRFNASPLPIKVNIHDICFTKKWKYNYFLTGNYSCRAAADMNFYHATVERYVRTVGIEHLTRLPAFRWPSLYQLSLGLALGKSKRRPQRA